MNVFELCLKVNPEIAVYTKILR